MNIPFSGHTRLIVVLGIISILDEPDSFLRRATFSGDSIAAPDRISGSSLPTSVRTESTVWASEIATSTFPTAGPRRHFEQQLPSCQRHTVRRRAGERIFEYKGLVTTWREATRTYARRADAGHTFLFGLSDGRVIDGGRGGNGARWLNHACKANCEAIEQSGRVYINALKDIQPGEELFIDYALEIPAKARESASEYTCRCGARRCRGTMLAPTYVGSAEASHHGSMWRRGEPVHQGAQASAHQALRIAFNVPLSYR